MSCEDSDTATIENIVKPNHSVARPCCYIVAIGMKLATLKCKNDLKCIQTLPFTKQNFYENNVSNPIVHIIAQVQNDLHQYQRDDQQTSSQAGSM